MKTIYQKLLFLLLLLPASMLAQSTIDGIVMDGKSKQPIPGVNVSVQGSSKGAITDFDGKFKLGGVKNGDKVVFSYVGYKNEIIVFSGQKSLSVTLNEESNELKEVVIQVGYGSVKKKDATGAVTVLSSKDFNKGPLVSADNLLNGKIAGVTVNAGGGGPGVQSEIRIRGGSSLNASNDPLIVLDGFPISNETNAGSRNFLATINPNDIESISVLKDASSTAIFGSRAANGVIIITTKKGGKNMSVEYNTQYASGSMFKRLNVLGADEFRQVIKDVKPASVGLLGNSNTDWQREIYRRTDYLDNNLAVRGNLFGRIPSRLSLGNTYQEGLRLTDNYTRNTISTNLNPSFFADHLKLKVSANYSSENSRFAPSVEGSAARFDPTQPVYDAASPFGGFFEYRTGSTLTPNAINNPVAQLMQTYNIGGNKRFFGNFEADYKFHFFPALRAIVNVGFDEQNGHGSNYTPTNAASAPRNNNIPYGYSETYNQMKRTKLMDSYFAFNKVFGDVNVEATAGYSYQIYEGNNFYTNNIWQPSYNTIGGTSRVKTPNVLEGYFGRAIISYKNKYTFTANFRRDGTSKFSKSNRWLNTPGLALAWKVREDFFKDSKFISDLKLRVGWGVSGQQSTTGIDALDNYYIQQYSIGFNTNQYYFGNTPYPIAISQAYNDQITWEKTSTYNLGVDYGFFNNRISGSLDVFYKESKELISQIASPDGSNFSNYFYANNGSFTTKGIELGISAQAFKSKDFNWNLNFTATKYERRIKTLANDAPLYTGFIGSGTGGTSQIRSIGYTPDSFYVYKQLYDNAGKPIEGAYADLNGDGIINGSDRYIYKNPDPDFIFGLASSMNYKNLDFSFNIRANVGNRVYNAYRASKANYSSLMNNTVLANIPSTVQDTGFNSISETILSDIYVENASFIRVDNITLGYTIPKWLEGKSSLRLFTGVQNAFLITKYSGLDPEVKGGIDNTIYPRQRSFVFGANVKF
ncbi:SusC/RagA family TonB-linked outer membrane protein [Flavobacterium sp. SUN046]|uniref:SusC/RagA family TonB-linked outer membrane protein n=1 Tax=Flavobacterium sp. SUN046 TaxID=3002440 RepID=UPI002DB6DD99|nr:SusC/RagA family TonB-linked outer membrane protein [Flavobacterium sp. SUN046]MEC4049165.1 SusC/RagA family TonB-linked outer membrane protein [Flavobacterium sp. SUN046]